MEFTLLHKTQDTQQLEMRVNLSCTLSDYQDRVDIVLTNAMDMFFLYEVSVTSENFRTVCTAYSYDCLHVSSLPGVLQSDILPTLSNTPAIASVGTDICILETDSNSETALLQFLTVRPSMRVPFFSIQLRKGSDRSVARNISIMAAQLEARLNEEINTFQMRMSKVEGEKLALESKLSLAETSVQQLEARLQTTAADYERRLADVQREKLMILDTKASVETKLADVLGELSALKSNSAMHVSQINAGTEELQRANARIAELERLSQEHERQYNDEVSSLHREIDRLNGILDAQKVEQQQVPSQVPSQVHLGHDHYAIAPSSLSNLGVVSHYKLQPSQQPPQQSTLSLLATKEERQPHPAAPTVHFAKDDDLTESSLSTNQTAISRARSTNARNILAKYGINSTHAAGSTHSNVSIPPKSTSINSLPVMQRLRQLELQAQDQMGSQGYASQLRGGHTASGTGNKVTFSDAAHQLPITDSAMAERLARYTTLSTLSASSAYSQQSMSRRPN